MPEPIYHVLSRSWRRPKPLNPPSAEPLPPPGEVVVDGPDHAGRTERGEQP
jgi:hypothetical protein